MKMSKAVLSDHQIQLIIDRWFGGLNGGTNLLELCRMVAKTQLSELVSYAGKHTSPAKVQASRENGKLGGRPRKERYESKGTPIEINIPTSTNARMQGTGSGSDGRYIKLLGKRRKR